MNRVATIPLQRTMSGAIQHSQQLLAKTIQQQSTGKKASDFASLGTEAVRDLSTHSLLAKQDSYVAVASRVGTTLSLYDVNLNAIDSAAGTLRQNIIEAIGTGSGAGLNASMAAAFGQFRSALNTTEGGVALFGGSQTDGPAFVPDTLAATIGVPASAAFANDQVKSSVRLADGLDVEYGVTASDVGTDLYTAFQSLAALGPIGDKPTQAQIDALGLVVGQLDKGLSGVRNINAENGQRQAQAETLGTRATERSILLQTVIADNEDVDLGQVAIDLAQQKTLLQASYSVFSQISGMTLSSYLR